VKSPTHSPSCGLPQRKSSRADVALSISLFVLLPAMLVFNLYLMFGGWLYHPVIFAIVAGLLVAGAFICFRSPSKRFLGLLMLAVGATAIGAALKVEYWSFVFDESMPIVCEVRDRDGAVIAGARCQVIDADSGEAVGEGFANSLGVAQFDARLNLRGSVSWVRSVQSFNSKYVVRASANGFRLKDEPLGLQRQPIDNNVITVAMFLEKAP
jgi:hypothetical protein